MPETLIQLTMVAQSVFFGEEGAGQVRSYVVVDYAVPVYLRIV
jgi:hypothetical protein